MLCGTGSTGVAYLIQFVDALTFIQTDSLLCGKSVHFDPPTGNTNFPINIAFFHAMLSKTPTWETEWSGDRNVAFLPFLQEEDGAGVPQPPFPQLSGIRGLSGSGALLVDGTADQTQLKVRGNDSQTTDIFVVEKSDGEDILNLRNTGVLIVSGEASDTIIEANNSTSGDAVLSLNLPGTIEWQVKADRSSNTFAIGTTASTPNMLTLRPNFDGLQWAGAPQATCAAPIRGTVNYVAANPGAPDTFRICRKDAGDNYSWQDLF